MVSIVQLLPYNAGSSISKIGGLSRGGGGADMAPITAHQKMTSSNGNIFRVTGHLCDEFTGHRWIPLTKASDADFDVFFDLRLE